MHAPEEYKAREERLLAAYQEAEDALQALFILALEDGDTSAARLYAEKRSALARLFGMGAYHEESCFLELHTLERDADETLETMRRMLDTAGTIGEFCHSPLFAHLSLRVPAQEYAAALREDLLEGFRDVSVYDFLKNDERWKELTQ